MVDRLASLAMWNAHELYQHHVEKVALQAKGFIATISGKQTRISARRLCVQQITIIDLTEKWFSIAAINLITCHLALASRSLVECISFVTKECKY